MKPSDKLDAIINTLTNIQVEQAKMSVTLQRNTEDLEDHMSRTKASEDRLMIVETTMSKLLTERKVAWAVLTAIGTGIMGLVGLAKNLGLL